MALFKTNKKEAEAKKDVSADKEKNKTVAKKAKVVKAVKTANDTKPKIRPHVTEKATFLSGKGVYVFRIKPEINKIMMKNFIKKISGDFNKSTTSDIYTKITQFIKTENPKPIVNIC